MTDETTITTPAPAPTRPEPPLLSRDGLMDFLFPTPGRYHLRLCVDGRASSTETFLQRRAVGWREIGPYKLDEAPGLDQLAVMHKWGRLRFAPTLTRTPSEGELGPVSAIWVTWNIPLLEARHPFERALARALSPGLPPDLSRTTIDPEAQQRVIDLIASLDSLPAHLVLDAGDTVTALWRLSELILEPAAEVFHWTKMRTSKLMHAMANQLGGDVRFADQPQHALLDLPGCKREDLTQLTPSPIVVAHVNHDAVPVEIEQMEWWVGEGLTAAARAAGSKA